MDFRDSFTGTLYNKDYSKLIDAFIMNVHMSLKAFDAYIEGITWFSGGRNPTICDFLMYKLLDQHRLTQPGIPNTYKNL